MIQTMSALLNPMSGRSSKFVLFLTYSKSDRSRQALPTEARSVKERRQTTEIDRQRICTALDLGIPLPKSINKWVLVESKYIMRWNMEPRHHLINMDASLKCSIRKQDRLWQDFSVTRHILKWSLVTYHRWHQNLGFKIMGRWPYKRQSSLRDMGGTHPRKRHSQIRMRRDKFD